MPNRELHLHSPREEWDQSLPCKTQRCHKDRQQPHEDEPRQDFRSFLCVGRPKHNESHLGCTQLLTSSHHSFPDVAATNGSWACATIPEGGIGSWAGGAAAAVAAEACIAATAATGSPSPSDKATAAAGGGSSPTSSEDRTSTAQEWRGLWPLWRRSGEGGRQQKAVPCRQIDVAGAWQGTHHFGRSSLFGGAGRAVVRGGLLLPPPQPR
mmetsp:Transcript_73434/g.153235  ORF Transcript_73434/g.153235 Transcript_73434/m.153235 type:complete len:210 (+) Transcript_73434:1315-1944(+)